MRNSTPARSASLLRSGISGGSRRLAHGGSSFRKDWTYVVSLRRKVALQRKLVKRWPARTRRPLTRDRVLQRGARARRRRRLRVADHAPARHAAPRRGDVALQPRGQQGGHRRRPRRPRLRRDRGRRPGGARLEGRDAPARALDPRGAQPPPLGGRADGGADEPRSQQRPLPRRGDGLPARGRLPLPRGGARLLRPGRLHLRLRAAGEEPRLRDAGGVRGEDRRPARAGPGDGRLPLPHGGGGAAAGRGLRLRRRVRVGARSDPRRAGAVPGRQSSSARAYDPRDDARSRPGTTRRRAVRSSRSSSA